MITGALGNVGSYAAKHAIALGQDVVVADIDVDRLQTIYQGAAKAVYFDFTKPASYHDALQDVDRVFIMRPPHLGKPQDLKPFIEALQQLNSIRLVSFLSLLGVEKNPVPPHHRIEKYIEQAGLPYCHIRPSFFMQNISGVHAFEIKHFDAIVVPVKQALTSFIDAEDIGEIVAKVLSEPEVHTSCAYSITGPEALNYDQAATILSQELNRSIRYANPKPSLAKKYWLEIRNLDREYTNVMSMLYMMTRFGGAKKTTTTFFEVMGKQPQTFAQFVRKNRQAWEK